MIKKLSHNMLNVYIMLMSSHIVASTSNFIGGDDASSGGIKSLFQNVYSNFDQVATLMGGSAYLAGLVFTVAAMMKIKQHRDNPTQVPVATGLVYLVAGVGLIFLPTTLREGATTIFTDAQNDNTGVSDAYIDNNPWAQ
jgi:intracellular multiplication protein IcmD